MEHSIAASAIAASMRARKPVSAQTAADNSLRHLRALSNKYHNQLSRPNKSNSNMKQKLRTSTVFGLVITALTIALVIGNRQVSFAIDETLPGYVTYFVDDTIYVELVGDHHLKPGDTGAIISKGRDAAYVRVTETGSRYIYVQIISQASGVTLSNGDSIVFQSRVQIHPKNTTPTDTKWHALDTLILGGGLDQNTTYQISAPWQVQPLVSGPEVPPMPTRINGPALPTHEYMPSPRGPRIANTNVTPTPSTPLPVNIEENPIPLAQTPEEVTPVATPAAAPVISSSTANGSTLKSAGPDKNMAPVLVPLSVTASSKLGNSRDANIFHGRLRSRELYQTVPSPESHTLESRLDSDGSIERLYASPWSAVWSGNLSYRDGNTSQTAPDYQHPKLNVYNAMMARKNDDGGTLKLGRFLPSELPGLGFLDGGQLDHVISPQWRTGGVLAMRPDRITLGLTSKEPFMAGYASTEQGTHGKLYYSGTLGMFHTIYRGKADELALLSDNRTDLGPKLNLFNSIQIDFNDGAEQAHKGPRITRLDFYGNSPITPTVSLRAGLSHFERPDIQAERDLTQGTTQGFDNGFWRYFVGANERLPFNFTLDEDLSTINSATSQTDQLWRLTISRFGFFFLPRGQISISAYNVTSAQGRGFGFQTTASTPLWTDKLSLNLSSSSQYSTPSNSPKNYNINDGSLHLSWRISKAWNADFGITQSYAGGKATSTIGDSSIGYRW
jgi:hypothetical protein